MYAGPSAASGPDVGIRNSGKFTGVPAIESARSQVAVGVAPPVQAATIAAGTPPGGHHDVALDGHPAPASAWSWRSAFTVPSVVPGACVAVTVVPVGTKMHARDRVLARGLTELERRHRTGLPYSSFGVVNAGERSGYRRAPLPRRYLWQRSRFVAHHLPPRCGESSQQKPQFIPSRRSRLAFTHCLLS